MSLPHQKMRGKLMWIGWVSGSMLLQGTSGCGSGGFLAACAPEHRGYDEFFVCDGINLCAHCIEWARSLLASLVDLGLCRSNP
eukprot:1140796-Pelagomonas_calceolata.AAC.4